MVKDVFFFVLFVFLKVVSLALLSLLRWCFSLGVPCFISLMYHCFFIFLFTKRIMLFVLSTVKQSLLQHWKAISLYETFTMYLLWLTFDSSSLLFTCTLGVIIEVNLFYTNTNSVVWYISLILSFVLFNAMSFLKVCYIIIWLVGLVSSEKERSRGLQTGIFIGSDGSSESDSVSSLRGLDVGPVLFTALTGTLFGWVINAITFIFPVNLLFSFYDVSATQC